MPGSPPPTTPHHLTSPVSLFFPPRTWSATNASLRPHLPLPPLTPLTPLSSLAFTQAQQPSQQQGAVTSHHSVSLGVAAAAALRQRIVRPSHRPAHCPACGRYFTFGHNMKAHLKRCPKNANRVVTSGHSSTSTTLSSALNTVLMSSPSRVLSPPTLLRSSSPPSLRLPSSPPPLPLLATSFNSHRLEKSSSPLSPSNSSSPSPSSFPETH